MANNQIGQKTLTKWEQYKMQKQELETKKDKQCKKKFGKK
jgi:hypothetical protein